MTHWLRYWWRTPDLIGLGNAARGRSDSFSRTSSFNHYEPILPDCFTMSL